MVVISIGKSSSNLIAFYQETLPTLSGPGLEHQRYHQWPTLDRGQASEVRVGSSSVMTTPAECGLPSKAEGPASEVCRIKDEPAVGFDCLGAVTGDVGNGHHRLVPSAGADFSPRQSAQVEYSRTRRNF